MWGLNKYTLGVEDTDLERYKDKLKKKFKKKKGKKKKYRRPVSFDQ